MKETWQEIPKRKSKGASELVLHDPHIRSDFVVVKFERGVLRVAVNELDVDKWKRTSIALSRKQTRELVDHLTKALKQ